MADSATVGPFRPAQFGRYHLFERVAVGGMAEIFKATVRGIHGFEKTVVVKRILPAHAARSDYLELFIEEARTMARLDHPKIVQVLDFGEVDGHYFMAMEYVDGLDLLELLRFCAKFRLQPGPALSAHIAGEVLDALEFAHSACDDSGRCMQLVHSDVSPSNIIISRHGEVKLGDFGIALGGDRDVPEGTLRGKYGYMSPEQVSGRRVDARADIFAAGVVLAELLMVRRLFLATRDVEVLLQVRDARLDRLERHGGTIPSDLRQIVEAALAREPDFRYQTAGAFRDALHRYLFDAGCMVRRTELREFVGRVLAERDPTAPAHPAAVPSGDARDDAAGKQPLAAGGRAAAESPRERAELAATQRYERVERPSVFGRKRKIKLTPPPQRVLPPLTDSGEMAAVDYGNVQRAGADEAAPAPESSDEFRRDDELSPPRTASEEPHGVPEPEWIAAARNTTAVVDEPPPISPKHEGQLAQRSLFSLLFELAIAEETGLVVVRGDHAVKEVHLVDGDPQYISSNREEELFGQYLLRCGVLSREQLTSALALLAHFDGKLGDTLVALKLLRPVQVLRHLTRLSREKLLDLLAWERGHYSYFAGVETEHASAPIGLDAFEVLGAAVESLPVELLEHRLRPALDRQLAATAALPVPPEVFRLGSLPGRLHHQVAAERPSLAELLAQHDGKPGGGAQPEGMDTPAARAAFLLIETGLLTLGS